MSVWPTIAEAVVVVRHFNVDNEVGHRRREGRSVARATPYDDVGVHLSCSDLPVCGHARRRDCSGVGSGILPPLPSHLRQVKVALDEGLVPLQVHEHSRRREKAACGVIGLPHMRSLPQRLRVVRQTARLVPRCEPDHVAAVLVDALDAHLELQPVLDDLREALQAVVEVPHVLVRLVAVRVIHAQVVRAVVEPCEVRLSTVIPEHEERL